MARVRRPRGGGLRRRDDGDAAVSARRRHGVRAVLVDARLTTIAATRRAVVDVGALMEGAEFDRKVALLAEAPTLLEHGEWPFLVTLARRSA
jgi:hypothetical protein